MATIDQVDKKSVQSFWRHAISIGRIPKGKYSSSLVLKKFGLVDDDNLTNAGEILFGNTRPVTLKMGIFVTDEKLTFLDMQMAEDNVYNLVGIAEEYIFKNMRWRPLISKGEREEIPEIPLAVIREVLANSFAHAMYNGRTNHEICIYPNKITIYSPGEYASKYTPEEYIEGNAESEIRNYIISKILYLNGTIEQFGSGFKRIYNLCKRAGIECSYENAKNGFRFIIHRPTLKDGDNDNVPTNVTTNLENVTTNLDNVTTNVTTSIISCDDLGKTELAVLKILMDREQFTREEIADRLSKTVRTVQRALNSLRDKGYIERVGPNQNITWEVVKNVRNNK